MEHKIPHGKIVKENMYKYVRVYALNLFSKENRKKKLCKVER